MENKKKLIDETIGDICNKCQLISPYVTNATDRRTSIKKVKAALMICAKSLASTLGPNGSTTIIEDQTGQHLVTKDGLDVITRLRFSDAVANIVLAQLRSIARNQVRLVGDGSTSAIIIANSLYQAITDLDAGKFDSFSGKDIVDILNELAKYFEEKIIQYSTPISSNFAELEMLAKISTNNDISCGKTIREIYNTIGKYGFITTNTTKAYTEDTVEYVTGMSWERGYIDSHYGEGFEKGVVKYEIKNGKTPKIFICRGRLDGSDAQMLGQVIGAVCGNNDPKKGANEDDLVPLIILAQSYSDDVKMWLQNNRHISRMMSLYDLPIMALDIDDCTRRSQDLVDNLSLLSGAKIYNKNKSILAQNDVILNVNDYIGSIKSVIATATHTDLIIDDTIVSSNNILKERVDNLIADLRNKIAFIENESDFTDDDQTEVYYLKSKLATLTKSSAIYHVGGLRNEERVSRERLIEDAIYACKSALKYGYVFGGNLVIPSIIRDNKNEIIDMLKHKFEYLDQLSFDFTAFIDSIDNAFKESYYLVLNNGSVADINGIIDKCLNEKLFYNLKLHKYEKIGDTTVINSAATDIEIMKSCFSIIGMLSTSNQIITSTFNTEI